MHGGVERRSCRDQRGQGPLGPLGPSGPFCDQSEWLYRRVALQNSAKKSWPLRKARALTKRPRDAADSQNPCRSRRRRHIAGFRGRNLRCALPWGSFSSFRASRPAPRTHLPPASPAALPRRWGVHAQEDDVYGYMVAGGCGSGAGHRMQTGRGLGRCGSQILNARTGNVCVSPCTKLREEAEDLLSAAISSVVAAALLDDAQRSRLVCVPPDIREV